MLLLWQNLNFEIGEIDMDTFYLFLFEIILELWKFSKIVQKVPVQYSPHIWSFAFHDFNQLWS